MSKHPETITYLGLALKHVLSEQAKLFRQRESSERLGQIFMKLNGLAELTAEYISEGRLTRVKAEQLTKQATAIENSADDLSEEMWKPIPIAVSSIYQRIEHTFDAQPGVRGFVVDVRSHFHNTRTRLLDQLLGARMLSSNSDLGDEVERIWQQYLERSLGPNFRVLRGGQVCDYEGNRSSQIDLIVVPSDAQIFFPSDIRDGKAQVLIDQVISVIMVTTNLTVGKLKLDWKNLQTVPSHENLQTDHPRIAEHPWPLAYIVATSSDEPESICEAWTKLSDDGSTKVVPQILISLTSCFAYSGHRKWPCPDHPYHNGNPNQAHAQIGKYIGLGLAWLTLQHRGRLAVINGNSLEPITRFAKLLHEANRNDDGVPVWSPRFSPHLCSEAFSGIFWWGPNYVWAHNRVALAAISVSASDPYRADKVEAEDGKWNIQISASLGSQALTVNREPRNGWRSTDNLRFFRAGVFQECGELISLEEWKDYRSKIDHKVKIVVFRKDTGEEVSDQFNLERVEDLQKCY